MYILSGNICILKNSKLLKLFTKCKKCNKHQESAIVTIKMHFKQAGGNIIHIIFMVITKQINSAL